MHYILQIVGVCILLVWLTVNHERKWRRFTHLLPGPIRFPFIGSIIQAGWHLKSGPNFEKFHNLCKRYGSTLGFQAGTQYFVVTEDLETAKELMCSETWHPRLPAHPMYKCITFNKNIGILGSFGADWREIRKFSIKTLVEKGFGNLNTADVYLTQEIEYMMTEFDEYRKKYNDEIRIHQYFNISVFNVIWKFIAGSRFEYDDVQMRKILHVMEETNRLVQLGSNPAYALPFLRYIPGLTEFDAVNYCSSHIHKLFKDILVERRVHGNFKHTQNDFIDHFLKMIDEGKNSTSSIYTDEQFLQCGTDLLIAGSDTTSNSIEFALLYLVKYPKVQERLRTEIDMVIGRHKCPSVFDKPKMPYAEAVVLEVLRNANVIPINTRVSLHDTKLNGFDVPEQSLALINLVKIHQNKKIWGDPEVFRPERFLDENLNIVNREKVFAFGLGKRVCIGLTMAKLTWFTFITTLIQKYTFEPSPTYPELSTNPDHGFANMPRPFHCIVKLRPYEEISTQSTK